MLAWKGGEPAPRVPPSVLVPVSCSLLRHSLRWWCWWWWGGEAFASSSHVMTQFIYLITNYAFRKGSVVVMQPNPVEGGQPLAVAPGVYT